MIITTVTLSIEPGIVSRLFWWSASRGSNWSDWNLMCFQLILCTYHFCFDYYLTQKSTLSINTVKWFFLTLTMFYSEELWCIRFKPKNQTKNTRGNCWSTIGVNTLQLSQLYTDLHYIAKLSRYLNPSLISSLRWAITFIGLFHWITTIKLSKLQYN